MKHKTAELTGDLLDAAVALALGRLVTADEPGWPKGDYLRMRKEFSGDHVVRWYGYDGELGGWEPMRNQGSPSTDWDVSGPIIEREGINPFSYTHEGVRYWAAHGEGGDPKSEHGTTSLLVAAMRAFVASKLGEEVELP